MRLIGLLLWGWMVTEARGQPFRMPTQNRALFEPNGEERFFAPTAGKTWASGTFGCVRSDGHRLHEGIDIRSLEHDRRGEPTDKVNATADGIVAYVNRRPGTSNYGNYVVLRHIIEGLEIYSTYAHLSEPRADLKAGQGVKAGEVIGVMGRTTNTRERIGKERAHVHFELNLFVNEHFSAWYKKHFPSQPDDHGIWNGQNLLGLDPRLILLAQHQEGAGFRLAGFIARETELCRVQVRQSDFPWVHRYAPLVKSGVAKDQIAGYELVLNFNGIPFQLIPKTAAELKGAGKYQLVAVNENEAKTHACRHLVVQRNGKWQLSEHGIQALDLITWK